jgi:hypothetical protein
MTEQVKPEEWQLEDDVIIAPNINPETPKSLYKSMIWSAIRESMDVGGSNKIIFERVKAWNQKNDPRLSEPHLEKMTDWAIMHWTEDIPLA